MESQVTVTVCRPKHVFVPTGSIWFGILANCIMLSAVSSDYHGWGKFETTTGSEGERIKVIIQVPYYFGGMGTFTAIIWCGLPIAIVGLTLSLIGLFIPGRNWLYLGLGFGLNVLAILIPFLYNAMCQVLWGPYVL